MDNQIPTEDLGEEFMDESMDPRNFMSGIYQNDEFMKLKSTFENELIDQTKAEVERKHIIQNADSVLADLKVWKAKRQKQRQEALD